VQDSRITDRTSLEELYRTDGPKLWRALAAYTAIPEVASDALAEAYAQALRRGDELTSPRAWIWRAAFRIAAGEMQRLRAEGGATIDRGQAAPETLQDLVEALEAISPNQRLAVILHDYADKPIAEVCEVMGIARATAYVHLSQGRRRLRALLEEDDDA
jgi:RNA polymerase sigma-70 factor (ECF subfamily)